MSGDDPGSADDPGRDRGGRDDAGSSGPDDAPGEGDAARGDRPTESRDDQQPPRALDGPDDPGRTERDRPGRDPGGSRGTEARGVTPPPTHYGDQQTRSRRGVRWWIHRFRTAESGTLMIVREVLYSALLVAAVGVLLFVISGVWPPMVAVQSSSMEPHMHRGDLVFVVEEGRFTADATIDGTGVAPFAAAERTDYRKFGSHGDVIVYEPNGSPLQDPIIHRAMFWVEEGENWYDRADPDHVRADSCTEMTNCPAPNSGFITKGDNERTNQYYDQVQGMSRPVKPAWIQGKAMVRVPALGWIRLIFADLAPALGYVFGAVALGGSLQGPVRMRP